MSDPPPSSPPELEQLALGHLGSCIIAAALQLGVVSAFGEQQVAYEVVAAQTGLPERSVIRLTRAMELFGLARAGEHHGRLTTLGRSLLRGEVASAIRALHEPWHWASPRLWTHLPQALATGDSVFEGEFGASLFAYLDEHPESAAAWDAYMGARSTSTAGDVLSAYDFSGAEVVVDVGGGSGATLRAVIDVHTHVRGVLFDLPRVIDNNHAAQRPDERYELVAGNFLAAVPKGADLYLLRQVVHNWADDDAVTILTNCRRAMRDDGLVLIIESLLGGPRNPTALIDLGMLLALGGAQRTEDEIRELMTLAGLCHTRTIRMADSPLALLEARADA